MPVPSPFSLSRIAFIKAAVPTRPFIKRSAFPLFISSQDLREASDSSLSSSTSNCFRSILAFSANSSIFSLLPTRIPSAIPSFRACSKASRTSSSCAEATAALLGPISFARFKMSLSDFICREMVRNTQKTLQFRP